MQKKLIKAKIILTVDIVFENSLDNPNLEQIARDVFYAHGEEILRQNEDAVVLNASEVKGLDDLPEDWDGRCLPWLTTCYSVTKPEKRIEDYFLEQGKG
jgi:hypothetical protein